MTEKLINSKPNGVFALILIELTIVLGIFIFIISTYSCRKCWSQISRQRTSQKLLYRSKRVM
ncbi:integral membrane protein [Streptococcus pneumoniae]|nr:integral membrane protein [Streptococcus pneumoniae]